MSVKSKHSSKKSSVSKKEKKRKLEDSDEEIESSEEELDLTKECHPIVYYLNDRAEMINQMFSVIKGNKLKAMLPPILKEYDLEQLKLQCLDQLLGMSEKRITCILEGETLETSSESEVMESEDFDSDEKNGTSGSSSERSEDSRDATQTNNVNSKHKKRKRDFSSERKSGKLPKTESDPPEQGKTLLEILELEMRARAIRALLKQSGNEKGSDQVSEEPKAELNGVKEGSSDMVVDLTECEDEETPLCVKSQKAEEEDIDKKVSSFEEKIEKAKVEKTNQQEDEKSKRLQAELELRNKLFKKKIYRTRQQRMENEEEEKPPEDNENEKNTVVEIQKIMIKQEPLEPEEITVEDPEEGEVSTSEDEYPVEIKKEPEEIPNVDSFEAKADEDAECVTAIDNGTFVGISTMENVSSNGVERAGDVDTPSENQKHLEKTENCAFLADEEEKQEKETSDAVGQNQTKITPETGNSVPQAEESEVAIEETSWRDRWLQKGGVQKLVKSSKIYAKVKKRIAQKSQKAKKEEVPNPYDINSDSSSNSKLEMIEGSISEYERLLGKNQGQKEDDLGRTDNLEQSVNNKCASDISKSEKEENT